LANVDLNQLFLLNSNFNNGAIMSLALGLNPAGFAVNGIIAAIRSIYHIAGDINAFMDEHTEKMKLSENLTISRTGRVLEGAKLGFGIGYTVPITIIALGQLLLGFSWKAAVNLGSAAVFSNPIAMTCAAIGAVYYGWNALSDQEKAETIESLRKDLDVGVELIKSIVQFVITKTNELLSSENLKELKEFISDAAHAFGRTLSEVTGAIKDRIVDAYYAATTVAEDAGVIVKGHATYAFETVATVAGDAGSSVKDHSSVTFEAIKTVAADVGSVVSKGSGNLADATKDFVTNAIDIAKNVSEDASKSIANKLNKNQPEKFD